MPRRAETAPALGGVRDVQVWLQPIIDLASGRPVAAEALARFRTNEDTHGAFETAYLSGYGLELELRCLRVALAARDRLPAGVRLSVNVSPGAVASSLDAMVWPAHLDDVIVELTEQYGPETLDTHLTELRARGAAIAVDDVSTGYAGLLRLAHLRPDYVKIDRRVIAGVRDSGAQSAVLDALVGLAHRIGALVIGEGVEHLDDLSAIADFDVDLAQGFAIGEPAPDLAPIDAEVTRICQDGRRRLLRQAASSVGSAAAQTRDMHAVTAALSRAVAQADLSAALDRAAVELGVDIIGMSLLGADETLHEVAAVGAPVDRVTYALDGYPATRAAVQAGALLEAHVDDPDSDPAEREVLDRLGQASMLLVPLIGAGVPIGVLELAHRTRRRWTSNDIAHARGLAEHVSNAIMRLGPARLQS